MNFTEVVNEVVAVTKRPDKIDSIRREVNAAINFYSMETNFAFDRQEQTVSLDASLYAQNIPLTTFTRFRKVDVMRVLNKKPLKQVDPQNLFDENGCDVSDAYYIAGTQINIKLRCLASSILVSFYSYPPVLTDASPDYWMLDLVPYMIIDRAASKIFNNIGDEKSMQTHKGYADEAYISAKRDFKYGANYG